MRCPKCGYVSFDHQDVCRKCRKPLGASLSEMNGTVYDAPAPSFLKLRTEEEKTLSGPVAPLFQEEEEIMEFDEEAMEEELEEAEGAALRPGIDTEFILEDEEDAPQEEIRMDLEGFAAEDSQADEQQPEPAAEESPGLDFGELDISDLAPAIEEDEQEEEYEELEFATAGPVAEVSAAAATIPVPQGGPKGKLEDLEFNGLDLETPSKLVSGSAAGKRYMPSVKTGTALDKFNIDLGDLFSDEQKQKK